MNKLSLIKSIKNLMHMKSINNLSLVKTIIERNVIISIPLRSLQHPNFIDKNCSL